jgi:acetyl-CoA carboxylase carboxyltransferase component
VERLEVTAPVAGTVAHVAVAVGDVVAAGQPVAYLELMKMEHPVAAPAAGRVTAVAVAVGEAVEPGQPIAVLAPVDAGAVDDEGADGVPQPAASAEAVREDLAEVLRRRALLADEARPEAVAARRARGMRTAREDVADLLDPGSASEYGGLAIAAQRQRRPLEELLARTPADGLITCTGTVNADLVGAERARVAVMAYDATVLAGTQGVTNHRKTDRLLRLALDHRLPVVVFAEGGGGRPGDTDALGASWLDAEAFRLFARLVGEVPTVAVVTGRCFAGNAALAGMADVVVATEGASLGMAGPAMIEGGGLGVVDPDDVGPMSVQVPNGVVDVLVADQAEAVHAVRRFLLATQGRLPAPTPQDQTALRDAVPANRRRTYDVGALLRVLADPGSVLELRAGAAPGMVTALARVGGRPVGVLANDPAHLGGAIDADAADSAVRHVGLCDALGLPLLVLCDTPGFMVGPEAECAGGVRRFSRMFVQGARLRVPVVAVVTRKAYGLGAQAMLGGHLGVPVLTVAWPTGELGPMGLEGAVRLGFRRDLDAVADPAERARREREFVDLAYAGAAALNVATFAEVDDVIDPADTRTRILQALAAVDAGPL